MRAKNVKICNKLLKHNISINLAQKNKQNIFLEKNFHYKK